MKYRMPTCINRIDVLCINIYKISHRTGIQFYYFAHGYAIKEAVFPPVHVFSSACFNEIIKNKIKHMSMTLCILYFKIHYFYICACVYEYLAYVCQCLWKPEEGVDSLSLE